MIETVDGLRIHRGWLDEEAVERHACCIRSEVEALDQFLELTQWIGKLYGRTMRPERIFNLRVLFRFECIGAEHARGHVRAA